jgi:hypothetical protein
VRLSFGWLPHNQQYPGIITLRIVGNIRHSDDKVFPMSAA